MDEKRLKSDTIFIKTNKLSIYDIHKFQTGIVVHNFLYNITMLPNDLISFFKKTSDVHCFLTRSIDNLCLHTHFGRLTVRIASTKVYAPTVWNEVPLHIKQASTLYLFKKQFKKHLLINSNK